MSKFDDFLKALPPQRDFIGKSEALSVPRGFDPGRVAGLLKERFGSDEELEAIEIIIGNESVGFVTRQSAYKLAPAQTKSIGSGGHSALPGIPDYKPIGLRCPICAYRLWIMTYDEDHPPTCPRHPEQQLELGR